MTISDQLINISSQLSLAKDKSDVLRIAAQLNELAATTLDTQTGTKNATSGFLKFTQKEISKMPKTFKKEFILNGAVAHVIKRPSGKHTFVYEIRYRRNGYNISASSKSLEEAKKKFIDKLIEETANAAQRAVSARSVRNIAEEWFECRRGHIHDNTYAHYRSYYERYIMPVIGNEDIRKVTSKTLNDVVRQVADKGRAYEDVRSVLNQIFVYAQNNGIITYNPVKAVAFVRHERQHGSALSPAEIRRLVEELNAPRFERYRSYFLFQLFYGLRPCEVATATYDSAFIIARNAKRKGGKQGHKRIPVPPEAKGLPLPSPVDHGYANRVFQEIFPDRKQYDLRHTFATVCQQYVRREIVEVWLGDSPERLIGNTYTHFPDEFMISEMQKVCFIPDKT